MNRARVLITLMVLPFMVGSCKSKGGDEAAPLAASAAPMGHAECKACGMVVRDQPAPRGQVVHRDGTRAHFCSVGDMLHYLESPSGHGAPVAIFVEALAADADPMKNDPTPRPWVRAEDAHYVTGVARKRIMGPPVLVYAKAQAADTAAKRHGGQRRPWKDLSQIIKK